MARVARLVNTCYSLRNIKGDCINVSESEMKTAIRKKDKKKIMMLIEGINPADVRDKTGSTLLHMAIRMRNFEIIEFLISIGCDINAQDKDCTTPLLAALELSCLPIVAQLLAANANIFRENHKGINALKMVVRFDQKYNREWLIELFARYLKACGLNGTELAPLLLAAGWPLHYAIYIGNSELIELMIKAGCHVNSRDEFTNYATALHKAICKDYFECAKILLQYGADVHIDNGFVSTPFEFITTKHPRVNVKLFEIVLKNELHLFNTDGGMKSYTSFKNASAQIINLLIKYKVKFTTKDASGSTLLHALVRNRNQEVLNLVTNLEVDFNTKGIDDNTPLHFAINDLSINWLMPLINKGADVNAKNKHGHTPLINAIRRNVSKHLIKILLRNGTILDEEMQNLVLHYIIKTNYRFTGIRPIIKRIAILHMQGEEVSTRNQLILKSNSSMNSFFECCCLQLHFMKVDLFLNSHISLFNILCDSEIQLSNYARNQEIVDIFFKSQVHYRYNIYGKMAMERFRRASIKQNLIQNAINTLSKIKHLNGNLETITHITKFLTRNDLDFLFIHR